SSSGWAWTAMSVRFAWFAIAAACTTVWPGAASPRSRKATKLFLPYEASALLAAVGGVAEAMTLAGTPGAEDGARRRVSRPPAPESAADGDPDLPVQ
ncbi:MAG TPA: hypothetical protein VKI64_09830, partial [Acidimicrobiales bacterium]|nr:hypothetical protein [Acidimicrobiales bacterium]